MIPTRPPRNWDEAKTAEIDAASAAGWIAVLPLAATEQHGPHLPLETDVLIADAFITRVQQQLSPDVPVMFLPVQRIGISTEHMDFPGTETLSYDVAIQDWLALGADIARIGIRKIVIVTSHGGNSAAMSITAQELRARHAMLAVATNWHRFGTPEGLFPDDELRHGVHGGGIETSIMLAAYPERVERDEIANFAPASVGFEKKFRWLSTNRPAPFAWMAQDLHPSGAIGNASLASAEAGEQLLAHGAKAFCELLADVNAFDLADLKTRP